MCCSDCSMPCKTTIDRYIYEWYLQGMYFVIEPRCEKTGFLHMWKQRRISFSSAFVFAIGIVQSLYYLNPKFQVSSHLVWLYSPDYVGPGRKPRRPVFSQRGLIINRKICLFLHTGHGVQRRMMSVDNFFVFLRLLFLLCCCYMRPSVRCGGYV